MNKCECGNYKADSWITCEACDPERLRAQIAQLTKERDDWKARAENERASGLMTTAAHAEALANLKVAKEALEDIATRKLYPGVAESMRDDAREALGKLKEKKE